MDKGLYEWVSEREILRARIGFANKYIPYWEDSLMDEQEDGRMDE